MPYYQKKDTSYQWVDDNIVLNQWNKILGRKPVHPRDKYGCLTVQEAGPDKGKIWENGSGRVVSPKFVEQLHSQGYEYNEDRNWFYREWSTWTPNGMRKVLESYQLSIEHNWIYRIVDPLQLGGLGGGGNASGWCIWESDEGGKDIKK